MLGRVTDSLNSYCHLLSCSLTLTPAIGHLWGRQSHSSFLLPFFRTLIYWAFGMFPGGSFLPLLHRVCDGLAALPALPTELKDAVTPCRCCPLQSTALAALPVAQLMMHIQRPLPISSSGDFFVIHGLQCIQLNKEHVLCTAEVNLYQGLNCHVWRGKAG